MTLRLHISLEAAGERAIGQSYNDIASRMKVVFP